MRLVMAILLLSCTGFGQTHLCVTHSHDKPDPVGVSFVYALKQQIAKSATYALEQDVTKCFALRIVSVPNTDAGIASALSLVLTSANLSKSPPFYLDNWVILVGTDRVDEQARNLMASVDEDISPFLK